MTPMTRAVAAALVALLAAGGTAAAAQKKKKPTAVQAECEKAKVALRYGLPDEGLRYAEQAVALDPASPEAWNVLGLARYQKKDFAAAAEAFTKALELKPDYAEVLFGLGRAFQETGEDAKAAEWLRKAEAATPDFRTAYSLGEVLFRLKDLPGALELADKAIARDGASAPAHNLRGVVLNELGRSADAVQSFLQAMRYAPDDPNPPVNLAIALINSGQDARAKAVLEEALPKVQSPTLKAKVEDLLKRLREGG